MIEAVHQSAGWGQEGCLRDNMGHGTGNEVLLCLGGMPLSLAHSFVMRDLLHTTMNDHTCVLNECNVASATVLISCPLCAQTCANRKVSRAWHRGPEVHLRVPMPGK